jgi:hypothetical protein
MLGAGSAAGCGGSSPATTGNETMPPSSETTTPVDEAGAAGQDTDTSNPCAGATTGDEPGAATTGDNPCGDPEATAADNPCGDSEATTDNPCGDPAWDQSDAGRVRGSGDEGSAPTGRGFVLA